MVTNVHRSLVTFYKTHIYLENKMVASDKKIGLLGCAYITELNTVRCSYPAMISSFIFMFHVFINFRHLRDYSTQSCCEYKRHMTLALISESKSDDINVRGFKNGVILFV